MTRARDLAAFVSNADGDIKFDTDTLFIDSSANRVGIGTTTPDTILELKGADPILTIRDSATSSGAANATLRLAETGASDTLDQYFDIKANNGQLEFIDNWNEGGGTGTRVVIDDSGNVGIGTTSPISALDLSGGADGTPKTMTLAQGNASSKAAAIVGVYGDTNSQGIKFLTNSFGQAERMRILPAGGLTFNGDTAAANALDDYEEGSWTPNDQSGAGLSFTTHYAKYVKIGKQVTVHLYLTYPSTSNGATASIGGLPFAVESSGYAALFINCSLGAFCAQVQQSTTRLNIKNATNVHQLNSTLSSQFIIFSGSYVVA